MGRLKDPVISTARLTIIAAVSLAGAAGAWAVNFLPDGVTPGAVSPTPSVVSLGSQAVVCVAVTTGRKAADMSDKIIAAHNRGYVFAKENGLKLGPGALEISARYQEPDGSWVTDACRSLQALPGRSYTEAPDLKFYEVPAGRAVQALHRGDHNAIDQTIEKVEAYIASQRLHRKGPLVEYHFNHKPPEEWDQQISVVTVYVE